jgi:phosphatidate phosphatase PAH1
MDIRRRAQEFKVAALRAVRMLFPREHNPFYSGFGYRQSDLLAYRKVGVPMAKVFIIDGTTGEFCNMNRTYRKSCDSLTEMVGAMFPPTGNAVEAVSSAADDAGGAAALQSPTAAAEQEGTKLRRGDEDERFNQVNFWKLPTPLVDTTELLDEY